MSAVTWVFGDDSFRVAEMIRVLPQRLKVETIDRLPDGASNAAVVQSVLGVSLLGGIKLIVSKDPQFLTSPSAPESIRFIESTLAAIPDGHYLLLVSSRSVDGRTKGAQLLKKLATVHELNSFKEWESGKVREWLTERVRSKGIVVSPDGIDLMIDTVGFETGILDQLVNTLAVYAGGSSKIDVSTVMAVLGARSGSIFRLTEALRANAHPVVVKELGALAEDGEDSVKILGIVAATLHQCLVTLEMMRQGKPFQDIGTVLERHPYSIQKGAAELKKHHTVERLSGMLVRLHALDLAFKSGQMAEAGMVPLIAGALK
jgi:DNA polymerase III delta subunit